MKVVIPRTPGRGKNSFSTPQSNYEDYDQTVWGEKPSDDFFQVSNVEIHGGQQVLTNNERIWR